VTSIDKTGKLLEGVDVGKGCIRFKKRDKMESASIVAFFEKLVAMWRDGSDFQC